MDLKQKIQFQDESETFLDQNGIYDLFDYLLKELLIDRPLDPLEYLIAKLSSRRRRRLFLIGGVGVKRRQIARDLSSRFQLEKIFLLDMLKAEVKKSGRWAQQIQKYWNAGMLVSDDIILEIMMPTIEELEKKGVSYILEGFPRTRVQSLALQRAGVIPDRIVFLKPNENEYKQSFLERYSELSVHKTENPVNLAEKALAEFNYHTRGVKSAYGSQVFEIEHMNDIEALKNSVFRVFLAKGRNKYPRKPPKVMVIGPPGSGKTSLASNLAKSYGLTFVSVNQLIRDQVNRKAEKHRDLQAIMNTGDIIPDYLINESLKNRLEEPECKINGWVLDGYPKTSEQAKFLKEFRIAPSHVIFLDCPDSIVYDRVEQRRLDPVTGNIYNVLALPNDEDIKNRVVRLEEDSHENVKKKLKVFNENKAKIHGEYSGIAFTIKADLDTNAITDLARESIENSIPTELE